MELIDKIKDKKEEILDKAKDNLRINKGQDINDSYDRQQEEGYYDEKFENLETQYMEPIDDNYEGNYEDEYYEEEHYEQDYSRRPSNRTSYKDRSRPKLLSRKDIAIDTHRVESQRVQENSALGKYKPRKDDDLSIKEKIEARSRNKELYKDVADFSSADIPAMRPESPRFMNIITPLAYEDCERISSSIRKGNITVLCFDQINKSLSTRLLDFAFGAASIKGANVDCLRPGLFVFVEGKALTDTELDELRHKGFLR